MTVLMLACANGHLKAVRLLLEYGVDLAIADETVRLPSFANHHTLQLTTIIFEKDGFTGLHFAALHGRHLIVKLLMLAGADLMIQSKVSP